MHKQTWLCQSTLLHAATDLAVSAHIIARSTQCREAHDCSHGNNLHKYHCLKLSQKVASAP